MASKLEYLQRYMAGGGGAADEKKRRKSKKKQTKEKKRKAALGTRVVDEDHEWEQDAPARDDIDQAWELDGGQEDLPVVVAEGGDVVETQDLPVYVNAEEFLGELRAKTEAAAVNGNDADLSPPRKPSARRSASDDDAASPQRRPRHPRASGSEHDLSPPRNQKQEPGRGRSDSDASPPRPAARRRPARGEDSGSDSPPRRPRQQDKSPVRKDRGRRSRSLSGASPPRRIKREQKTEEPKEGGIRDRERGRERRVDSMGRDIVKREVKRGDDSDASPPRKGRAASPAPRDARGHDCERRVDSMGRDIVKREATSEDDDASPVRRRRPVAVRRSTRDRSRSRSKHRRSPPRDRRSSSRSRRSRRSDRRASRERSVSAGRRSRPRDSRASPPRRPRDRSRDRRRRSRSRSLSERRDRRGGRRSSRSRDGSRDRRSGERSGPKSSTSHAPVKTKAAVASPPALPKPARRKEEKDPLPPVRAGLFTADEFEQNRQAAARSKDLLHGVDAKDMGANAETVYRDKRGRKLDMLNEMMRQQEIVEGKRKREAREEYEWGTGKVQKQERRSQKELLEKIQQQPFARREDDEELERMRKERVRAFDPMDSKLFKEDAALYGGEDGKKKKTKKSGKKSGKKASSKPSYTGPPAPPNRFGIRPGYRWDGVVRGTGWEEKLLLRENASAATSEEMYKYAVADM